MLTSVFRGIDCLSGRPRLQPELVAQPIAQISFRLRQCKFVVAACADVGPHRAAGEMDGNVRASESLL
jgi:hypothetical protein